MSISCTRIRHQVRVLACAGLGVLSVVWTANCFAQEPAASLTAEQVVSEMAKRNQQRAEALRGYTSLRTYHCEYQGLGDRRADLIVKMSYVSPDKKEFTIVSESGSELLRKHVLRKLIEAEQEAASEENRRSTAMKPENYDFRLVEIDQDATGTYYVLDVSPKKSNKFLFRGRIWVDAKDFAVTRMEGEPAKNPSWWVKKVSIDVQYRKIGDFWLLARNQTLTQVRIRGHALMTIDYGDYHVGEAHTPPAALLAPLSGASRQCATEAAPASCANQSN